MMSDALDAKVVEILDKSQVAIAAFADQLGDLAKQYGPDVADAALQMARIDALSGLIIPCVLFVTLIVGARIIFPRYWKYTRDIEANLKERGSFCQGDPTAFFMMVTGAYTVATLTVFFFATNLWRWVGLFEPKLWLAKRVLGL